MDRRTDRETDMGRVGDGRQAHCTSHSPLPRAVDSVRFSANKKRGGDRRQGRGVRKTQRDNKHKTGAGGFAFPTHGNLFRFRGVALRQTSLWNDTFH